MLRSNDRSVGRCLATTPERSLQMSLVRSKGNRSTELRMLIILRAAHITGWRRHLSLPGRPDFAFPNERLALFVDGCFWHGCPKCARRPPKSNAPFWAAKIRGNELRDRRVNRELCAQGWRVLRLWEHCLSDSARVGARTRLALAKAAARRAQDSA